MKAYVDELWHLASLVPEKHAATSKTMFEPSHDRDNDLCKHENNRHNNEENMRHARLPSELMSELHSQNGRLPKHRR